MARKKTTSGDKPSPATPLTHPAGTERLNEIAHVLYQLAFKIELKAQATDTHSQPLGAFRFSELQRQVLLSGLKLPKSLTAKLSRRTSVLTTEEVTGLTMSLSHLLTAESQRLASLLQMGQHLADQLQQELASPSTARQRSRGAARKKADPQAVLQFKISLSRMRPAVWRRIQVRDCTLDQLHEHIQTAMGWENCHLHEFDIQGERYGDPQLLSEGVGDFVGIDSTKTRLSDILPAGTQPLGFRYTYDFGDGWDHDILYEGRPPCDPQVKYPVCLEGANACPPEDSGGVPGYENLLEALRDPKHEDHERLCEWVGDDFDPAAFDEKAATKAMQRGLPDWR